MKCDKTYVSWVLGVYVGCGYVSVWFFTTQSLGDSTKDPKKLGTGIWHIKEKSIKNKLYVKTFY